MVVFFSVSLRGWNRCCFFFSSRRRHTRWPRDWSSDVCSSDLGEEALKSKGRAWSNYAEAYRPLVEFAKENRLPVIAANAPASFVRCVGQDGPEALSRATPERRGFAAAELHLDTQLYKDKFVRFLREDMLHGSPDSDKSNGAPTPA